MHPDPISSALTEDNRKESKRNHRRERQDINTTSRCVVWAGLKLILLPCPPFFLLSRGTKGPACASLSTQQKWLGPNPHRARGPVGGRLGAKGWTMGLAREPGQYGQRGTGRSLRISEDGRIPGGQTGMKGGTTGVCVGGGGGSTSRRRVERKVGEEGQKCGPRPRAASKTQFGRRTET